MEYKKEDFYNALEDNFISHDLQFLLEDILDRIKNPDDTDDVLQAIDASIIWYEDQWTILQEYCTPQEANWEYAIEEFINLVFSVSARL